MEETAGRNHRSVTAFFRYRTQRLLFTLTLLHLILIYAPNIRRLIFLPIDEAQEKSSRSTKLQINEKLFKVKIKFERFNNLT